MPAPQQPSPAQALAPMSRQEVFEMPLKMVGGNKFGRYPKISDEQTFNMMISDDFLVDYAGYQFKLLLSNNPLGRGRGIFSSTIQDIMIVIVSSGVFSVDLNLTATYIGTLDTTDGEVYIAENNAGQIAMSDGVNIYIYNPVTTVFVKAQKQGGGPLDFKPGFLSFQNTYFICASIDTPQWRLSLNNDGLTWPNDSSAQYVGTLQTKPDTVQGVVPMPGRGNMAFVFGHTVSEQWTFTGQTLFPYQRSSSFNIDYGCINPSSIAYQGNFIVWIGINEEAGPVVMYTTGGDVKEVSTDGIDFVLSQLKHPEDCSGFLVKLDGHLFYQFTFHSDNVSYILDLTNEVFFTVTDENFNFHIARKVVYFNNTYYFVSFSDPNLYEFGTKFTTYDYGYGFVFDIPRVRICPPIRMASQRPFIVKNMSFTIEQGQQNTGNNMAVDLSVSRDGAETFSSYVRYPMNQTGMRTSRMEFLRLGRANEFTAKFNFVGRNRFVLTDGVAQVYL